MAQLIMELAGYWKKPAYKLFKSIPLDKVDKRSYKMQGGGPWTALTPKCFSKTLQYWLLYHELGLQSQHRATSVKLFVCSEPKQTNVLYYSYIVNVKRCF